MAGQFNKKELELLMGEITRSEPNITPDQYRELKGMEEMKPGSYPFRFMKEAPSENEFMKLLEASIKDTKPEGVMTAGNTRIIELNSLIDPDMDPGDLRTIYDDMMRESGGNYPGVDFDTFLKSIGTRKAAEGGDAKEENPLRQFRDDYEMLIGFPSEVLREETKVKMRLLDSDIFEKAKDKEEFKKIFYDEYAPTMKFLDSLSDEERKKALDIILSKRAEREIDRAEAEGVESLMSRGMAMAEGGIVSLKDGGDPDDVPLKKTIKTPSTYGKRVFEDFLFDAGFVKIDPDTGKPRGSKGEFNKFLLKKGIKPGSDAGTTELNKILKKLGKPMYISLEMAQGAQGLSLAEEATGTKKGTLGAAQRKDVFEGVDQIRKEANKMDFKNTDQKYNFIKKEIKKKFPAIGAATLANLAKGTALGMGLEMFMPQELQAATIYSPEDMDKMLGEMAIREKFK
jgi:hypothetical protein